MNKFLTYISTIKDRLSCDSDFRIADQSKYLQRYFEVPEEEIEVLRILEDLALLSAECSSICTPVSLDWLKTTMRDGIARVDYALIEKGRDHGDLISQLHKDYYDRKSDLSKCGHTKPMINHYLKKYSIEILSNKQYEDAEKNRQRRDFKKTKQYQDAVECGFCNEDGVLLIKKSEYTRFAVAKYDINTTSKYYWQEYDRIFIDKKGKVISYTSFMQSCRDQELQLIKEKNKEDYPELVGRSGSKKSK